LEGPALERLASWAREHGDDALRPLGVTVSQMNVADWLLSMIGEFPDAPMPDPARKTDG
jgi:hypothetical protein